MRHYTRRDFLKASSGLLGAPFLLSACDQAPGSSSAISRSAGRWEPFAGAVPVAAWSAALLPTGEVLLFRSGRRMYLWDPDTRQFEQTAAHTNLYCAGLAFLADGRLLGVGGHKDIEDGEFLGLSSAEVFDPWKKQWTRLPNMKGGKRWYPTAVTLSDGRVLVASGTHAGTLNETIERFDPTVQEWEVMTERRFPLYPWATPRPDDTILFYGPQTETVAYDWAADSFSRRDYMSTRRGAGAGAVLHGASDAFLAVGGGHSATRTAEVFDPSTGVWTSIGKMDDARRYPDLVCLPDGSVLAVGGERGEHDHDHHGDQEGAESVTSAEILDPDRGEWQSAGEMNYGHGYHSTALLLPDGRVLAAGPAKNMELYRPWYVSAPNRPEIVTAPSRVDYEEAFTVEVAPKATDIAQVVLIRTSSVTHSLNTDQRYLTLEHELISAPGPPSDWRRRTVQSPMSSGRAPPGYYLLFAVNGASVPSEGQFVWLG